MQPDETNTKDNTLGGSEPVTPPLAAAVPVQATPDSQREAATNVIRTQIDSLYGGQQQPAALTEPAATPTVAPNPYARTHTDTPEPQADQWKAYHSAWQNYYQKYYEAYYIQHLGEGKRDEPDHRTHAERHYFGEGQAPIIEVAPEEMTKDEALFDLRQKLLGRVQKSAKKVRKSRHFLPLVSAAFVILLFVFLQYNGFIIGTVAAYVSPGSIDPQNIVVDPNTDVSVSQDPRIIIPKINVDVPVSYDIGNDYDSQMAGMKTGLAHFAIPGASSHPGEIGNTVLAGHSANDIFDAGDYKFIFAQLDKLVIGDTIYANYKGIRYTYVVTKTQVVKPTDVSTLVYPTTKPVMTLLTCVPVGTAQSRLLVSADQVSPDPTAAVASTGAPASDSSSTSLPGESSKTVFEKLFGN